MRNFREIKVWKKSHCLAVLIYRYTVDFPKHEIYGITNQIRRAAISIPANIAEGCGRESDADFSRFLSIALGSANELDYFLVLTKDLKLLDDSNYLLLNQRVVEIKKMLSTFINRLKYKSR